MKKQAAAEVTPVRQRTQYTCMAASMMMCLQANGQTCDEDEVNRVMGARPMEGAAWEEALACAQHYGMRATLTVPATVKQIKEWTDRGIPVMIAWNPEGRPWSHASVVFDVAEDGTVSVADPNIPNPEETVRKVSTDEFYHLWYEKWPNYLVRRPAMAVEREITKDGRQVMASRQKQAEAHDCVQDYRAGGLTYEEYQDCLKRMEALEHQSDSQYYNSRALWYSNWAEIARLMGRDSDAKFIKSIADYVRSRHKETSPKQDAILARMRKHYERELQNTGETLRRMRDEQKHNAPVPVEPTHHVEMQFDAKTIDILRSLVQRTGNQALREMLALVEGGTSLTEDQLKVIRAQFHRYGQHANANLFRLKTAALSQPLSTRPDYGSFTSRNEDTEMEVSASTGRPLSEIAREIATDLKSWRGGKVYYAAKPYLDAMLTLNSIDDPYYEDSGSSVVAYFLANAQAYQGPVAKQRKAELKKMLEAVYRRAASRVADRHLKAKYPPRAMNYNNLPDTEGFWDWDIREASRVSGVIPPTNSKNVGDLIFWLNMVGGMWETQHKGK